MRCCWFLVEALRVGFAFSKARGEGCVWRPSKDLIFFSAATDEINSLSFLVMLGSSEETTRAPRLSGGFVH